MAGLDRILDPTTGDYVSDGSGGYAKTSTARTKLYHQIKTHLGTWWGDFEAGSAVYQVTRGSLAAKDVQAAKNAVKSSLQPFLEQGLIKDVRCEAEPSAHGQLRLFTQVTDTQGGRIDVSDLTPFG